MFNPLKMNPVEKRLLIGGLVGAFTHMGEYAMERVVPNYPPELKQPLDPHLPPNGELVTLIAPPVATQVAKRVVRGTDTKEKIGDIGFGMMLYSLPRLVQRIGSETAYQLGVESKPAARLTAPTQVARYTQTTTPTRTAVAPTVGKYRLTA